MNKSVLVIICFIISLIAIGVSCNTLKEIFEVSDHPYDQYKQALLESKLSDKQMVKQWVTSGDSALSSPVEGMLPQEIKLTYFKDEPIAYAWKFDIPRGRVFQANLSRSDTSHQVFIDLYSIENGNTSLETSAEDSLLEFKAERSRTFILRVQPELLVSGSVNLTITDHPSLVFPVSDVSRSSIRSFWGDPRDGGARQHEGLDIFAQRGTPAIAAAEGRVTRTGTSRLGGNIVWMRAEGLSLYYAHLDSIIAFTTQRVQAGDTLGLVGNTGNARTTPPHLHFGIYDRGAVNPFPFIDEANIDYQPLDLNRELFGNWVRIGTPKANIRQTPSTSESPIASIERHTALKVLGGTGSWYHIELPNSQRAFIYKTLLEETDQPIQSISAAEGDTLFENSTTSKPLKILDSAADMDSYAYSKKRQLVKYKKHFVWLKKES